MPGGCEHSTVNRGGPWIWDKFYMRIYGMCWIYSAQLLPVALHGWDAAVARSRRHPYSAAQRCTSTVRYRASYSMSDACPWRRFLQMNRVPSKRACLSIGTVPKVSLEL